jgi:hypothetical protein
MHIRRFVFAVAMALTIALGFEAKAAPVTDEKPAAAPNNDDRAAWLVELQAADDIVATLAQVGATLNAMAKDGADHRSAVKEALAGVSQAQSQLPGLKAAFAEAARVAGPNGGEAAVANLEKSLARLARRLRAAARDLETQDELDFPDFQGLLGSYNQAEAIASALQKKRDDTENASGGKT